MHVLVAARDPNKARHAAERIGAGAQPIALDVTDARSIASAFARINHLDVLVNNAAIDYDTDQRAATADLDRARRAIEINPFGAWAVAQTAIPLLRRGRSPRLVNVSSEAGSLSGMSGGIPGYGLTKTALNALTLKLADELRRDGVLVNAVCPGWTATDMGGGGRPVADGALSVVWAAVLPDDGPTGGFFRDGRPIAL